jgi:hypothetical protein
MKLSHGIHLAYCTNVHRGETWVETFDALNKYTLRIRERVSPRKPFAIGLRLSHRAARELRDEKTLTVFRKWMDANDCYVFTINGFPYGQFHGARVKDQVYMPDWTSPERADYTNLLFDLLSDMLPAGVSGSVSTVPCGFKPLVTSEIQHAAIRANLMKTTVHIAELGATKNQDLHLGLEPEPGCVLETTDEAVDFFERLRSDYSNDDRINRHLGINYDACHLAVEYEDATEGLDQLKRNEIRLSKLHLSSALKARETNETRMALSGFVDSVYLHQTVIRSGDGQVQRFNDLDEALSEAPHHPETEWRVHFHVPLHANPAMGLGNTSDHLLKTIDWLGRNRDACAHLEMETYTWEVMPEPLRARNVVDQITAEYDWTLRRLAASGITVPGD